MAESVRKPTETRITKELANAKKKFKTVNPMSTEGRNLKKRIKRLEGLSTPVSQKFTGTGKTIGDKKTKTGQYKEKAPEVKTPLFKLKDDASERRRKKRLAEEKANREKVRLAKGRKTSEKLQDIPPVSKPKKKVPYQKKTSPVKALPKKKIVTTKKKDKPSSSPSLWKQFGSAAKKLFGDDPKGAVSLGTASPDDSAEIKRRRKEGLKKLAKTSPRALEVASSKKAAVDKSQAALKLARKRSKVSPVNMPAQIYRGTLTPKKVVKNQAVVPIGEPKRKPKPPVGGEKPGMRIGSQVGKRKPAIKGIADSLAVGPKPKPQTLEQKLKAKFVERRGGEGAFGKRGSDAAWKTHVLDMRRGSEVGLTYKDTQDYDTIIEERKEATEKKRGGRVGKKKQGYKARKDESIAMRVKKKRTKKQLKASRSDSYGKFGSGKGKGKINRSGAALVASSYD